MKINRIEQKSDWDNWLKANSQHGNFIQSWAWGDILLAESKKVQRLSVDDGTGIAMRGQIVYQRLPFGLKYAFCAKGPVSGSAHSVFNYQAFNCLIEYIKEQGCSFFRVELPHPLENIDFQVVKTLDTTPRATVILDISRPEHEILQAMKSKTRYNIGLAERKALKIIEKKDPDSFINLSEETAKRDGFRLHPKQRYQEVLNSDLSHQISIEYEGKIIASSVFTSFGNMFTYLYGASDYEHRKLMAPYLLQWLGIKKAKQAQCKYYDFFGIAPLDQDQNYNKNHQYAGVTRFKLGFGGEIIQSPGTCDVVINKNKYFLYKFLRWLRRKV
ncbi:MAG: peptidoglycan bridge formation glycyltransferase FemA/FemB family protein [bacterium]